MSKTTIPNNYKSKLSLYETQKAIGFIKRNFEDNLKDRLNLKRVSAPLIVSSDKGINDDLNGIERPVSFDALDNIERIEIVHSLAKWKRMALSLYGFPTYEGIYTDMNAIRRDEELDNIHSIYVDQWDWELVVKKQDRTIDYLKHVVNQIVFAIKDTEKFIHSQFNALTTQINKDVFFITTQELYDMYPNFTPKQRENEITKKYKTVFLMQIGKTLKSGEKHDGRAPDYDDWELNGDLLLYNEILESAIELSSMGIRVDKHSLDLQLNLSNANDRRKFEFHSLLLEDKLPFTIGGGIGQSRLCMLLLEKAHIGEVQVSVWDSDTIKACKENNLILL